MADSAATILVRVIPRAGRTEVAGRRGGAILVRLAAAPVEGAANEALVEALADRLGCPRRAVTIVSGGRSRDKRIRIEGFTAADAERRLLGP
jgi:uncharacterized protein (TIGR00251 family)